VPEVPDVPLVPEVTLVPVGLDELGGLVFVVPLAPEVPAVPALAPDEVVPLLPSQPTRVPKRVAMPPNISSRRIVFIFSFGSIMSYPLLH
jgi:hypothetical protein